MEQNRLAIEATFEHENETPLKKEEILSIYAAFNELLSKSEPIGIYSCSVTLNGEDLAMDKIADLED